MNRRERRTAAKRGKPAGGAPGGGLFAEALRRHRAGQLKEAHEVCRQLLALDPNNADALHLDGLIACQLGFAPAGIELFTKAIALNGMDPALHNNLAEACRTLDRLDEAAAHYRRAIALAPNFAAAHGGLGNALLQQGRLDEAIAAYARSIALAPEQAAARNNLRAALRRQGDTLLAQKRHEEALASYDRALALQPSDPTALNDRGRTLSELGRYEEALASYDRALAVEPGHPEILNNRGGVLRQLKRHGEALASYDRALAIEPDHPGFLNNRGNALLELGRYEAAPRDFARLLEIEPDYDYAPGNLLYCRLFCCDWADYGRMAARIEGAVLAGKRASLPFMFLSMSDSGSAQLACAETYAADKYPAAEPVWQGERYRHERIRVAYLSADFRHHAVANSLAQLFEGHDRSRFETFGVSFGPEDSGDFRARLEKSFGRFIDARDKSDREIVRLIRELEIDIAVDLTGYTNNGRPGVFALRPAPIQVNYLGYLGSMGADYLDYIIADRVVIPEDAHSCYRENIVYLPDAFLPHDSTRRIGERRPSRREAGLPETGFVFCAINSNYKIAPPLFDMWLRLLRQVDGSVLWLLEDAAVAVANRRRRAAERGIDPDRLVFASRTSLEDHLARLRLADLFLDTSPYNAGATACDALWAGLPVVTCLGGSFVGRMAASLLHAVGLPELITESLTEYEALALELARDPGRLATVTARLTQNRETCALFDADRYRRHLESAYETMRERHRRGEAPVGFAVAPIATGRRASSIRHASFIKPPSGRG